MTKPPSCKESESSHPLTRKVTAFAKPLLDTVPKKRQSPPQVCRCLFNCSVEKIKREDGAPLKHICWRPFRRCPRNGRRRYESLQPLCICMGRRLVTGNCLVALRKPGDRPAVAFTCAIAVGGACENCIFARLPADLSSTPPPNPLPKSTTKRVRVRSHWKIQWFCKNSKLRPLLQVRYY